MNCFNILQAENKNDRNMFFFKPYVINHMICHTHLCIKNIISMLVYTWIRMTPRQ